MAAKKSSFFKFFYYSFSIFIFCILFSSILIVSFCSKLYKDEKFKEIESASNLFISGIQNEFELTNTMYSSNISRYHRNFVNNYNISFYVYDEYGNCILSADNNDYAPLADNLRAELDDDTILDFDASEISNKEPSILYGDRFYLRYGEDKAQRMYLTAYSPTDNINSFMLKLTVFVCAVSAVCIFFAHMFLKKQAKEHSDSAQDFLRISENFTKNDFSERITVSIPGNLQEISKYVNALADNMEKSEDTSKTFIANVSHELRTPITTIGGFVDGILDGTIPKSRQQEYLVLVSNEIKRLRILISSMLNMTRFESGTLKPNFKETNLTELVIQTVLMFEKKINDKHLEIEGLDYERLVAVADSDLIQQVIYNLVENAVKFVNTKGTISFRFEKENGKCVVGIKNTGDGLENKEIQQVFDRFYKADSSRGKDTTGLGLGLSISRKIVHLHNGQIIVKSVKGEYTEFAIHIPEKQK